MAVSNESLREPKPVSGPSAIAHENISPTLSLKDASRITDPIIYGLCGPDGAVFYVGQTRSACSRMASHRNVRTKNAALRERLAALRGTVRVVILERNPADLNAAERRHIARYGDQLVNLVGADHWSWSTNSDVPWAAGTGILCPSAFALQRTPEHMKPAIREAMSRMSVKERCAFELRVLMGLPIGFRLRFDRWCEIAGPKMLAVLEA
ncbi:MAG: hypothetical protein GC208_09645 [Alphaproteobacteria bacterium]|nr:hypothetical protein [Alphaproteobacteria bacterium]